MPGGLTSHRGLAALLVAVLAMALGGVAAARPAAAQTPYSPDRVGTAAAIAADAFPDGADVAILASGEDYPDALAAAPLAAFYNAPILLTGHATVPPATTQALTDLGVADVLVVGGTAAISTDVSNALELDHQVSRVAGGAADVVVQVFFINAELGDPCGEVFPVQRPVAAPAVAAGALTELLRGPTPAEVAEGYGGWFSEDTAGTLNSVRIEDGVAYADFADFSGIIPNASTSCGSAGLLAQLNQTLLQFDGVEATRYSFDGDAEAFYSWLQLAVPDL